MWFGPKMKEKNNKKKGDFTDHQVICFIINNKIESETRMIYQVITRFRTYNCPLPFQLDNCFSNLVLRGWSKYRIWEWILNRYCHFLRGYDLVKNKNAQSYTFSSLFLCYYFHISLWSSNLFITEKQFKWYNIDLELICSFILGDIFFKD